MTDDALVTVTVAFAIFIALLTVGVYAFLLFR
jgi:hypothetical protein